MASIINHPATFNLGFALSRRIPSSLQYFIAEAIAEAHRLFGRKDVRLVEQNLMKVFDNDLQRARRTVPLLFRNYARYLVDYVRITSMGEKAADAITLQTRGVDHIRSALSRGKGAIICSAHLGNWELGGLLLSREKLRVSIVTLPDPNPKLTRFKSDNRKAIGIDTITLGHSKWAFVEIVSRLRRNEVVAMLIDRPVTTRSEPVSFFGHEAMFCSGPAHLARLTGAALIPSFILQDGPFRYQVISEPCVEISDRSPESASVAKVTQELAQVVERYVRENPTQWYNFTPVFSADGE